ncbi:hypothetical protein RM549_06510 [Salegentibacter sp. F188]|uniref:Uncharacterized protein n=1 Tax=Autumnicola patrickiae TaxID=3075591 RepID=A0ABU3E169_9FLAO|nr:hypothetical protein [Salegentibacter sp. F188]MDT0689429.1 hypothetical protein [Salegentibacter sp. F188]
MKRFLFFLLYLLLFTACENDAEKNLPIYNEIHEDASVIIQSPDLKEFFSQVSQNPLLSDKVFQIEDLKDQLNFIEHIDSIGESIISIRKTEKEESHYLLVTKGQPKINLDSIGNKSLETFKAENWQIKHYTLEGISTYISEKGGNFLASNSREVLEKSLQDKSNVENGNFRQLVAATDKAKTSVFINHQTNTGIQAFFEGLQVGRDQKLANWSAVDLELEEKAIRFNGIAITAQDSASILNIFKGTGVNRNEIAQITPSSASGFLSFTFNNAEILQQNLKKTQHDTIFEAVDLYSEVNEVGLIYIEGNPLFIMKSINIEKTFQKVLSKSSAKFGNYRDTEIFSIDETPEFVRSFSSLITIENPKYFIRLNNFLIFGSSTNVLEKVIVDFLNNNSLSEKAYYQEAMEQLSSESSMLMVANGKDFLPLLTKAVPENAKSDVLNIDLQNYRIGAVQFVQEDDFAHIHGIIHESEQTQSSNAAPEEVFSVALEAELATRPFFFKNHLTNQMDIAVQDVDNTLYLISNKNNIYWKKQLKSRIIGNVHEMDLLKNGKFQLAFGTQNSVEILDRNGNNVKPFPLQFNDPITQPLSVFDYDNNRKFRFVVTQEDRIYMYNGDGKPVKGFDFSKAASEITNPPKHIRIGTKDYILIAENSGKINILSRQGDVRVPVAETFDLSGNDWYEYQDRFISTSAAGELISIDQLGKVQKENRNLAENHYLNATPKTLVTLSDNILSIEGKKVELDFGLYTKPQIFYVNNRVLISVTDTQAKRVYIFNSNAELLEGFPVYGTSQIDLNNADLDRNLEFVVQGDDNAILYYKF